MKSEELRQEMLKFLDENGMMKSIVAKQTGLSRSILSSWFSGRANLRGGCKFFCVYGGKVLPIRFRYVQYCVESWS